MRAVNEVMFDCSLRGLGILNYESMRWTDELFLVSKLMRNIIDGDKLVCVDVGANIGEYAEMVLGYYPDASLICIEPHPLNFSQLHERQRLKEQILLQCAAGAEAGELTLFDRADAAGEGSQHASLHKKVITDLHKQNVVQFRVKIISLDSLVLERKIASIDLLKIDTEGHELEVLHGASYILENKIAKVIHIEFNEMNVISRVFLRDIKDKLHDYKAFRLLPNGMIRIPDAPLYSELFGFQNIVFIRNDLQWACL